MPLQRAAPKGDSALQPHEARPSLGESKLGRCNLTENLWSRISLFQTIPLTSLIAIRTPEPVVRIRVPPAVSQLQTRLPRLVGPQSISLEHQRSGPESGERSLFTGDLMTAAEAERVGLINHVVPADQLDEKV
jgi:hypothetical protein